jgi:hypothetical protein
MEFRPEGLAFFWPLITLFVRYISSDMLLTNIMIINPKSLPANVKVISVRLLRKKETENDEEMFLSSDGMCGSAVN